jgi:hypothetical protein
MSLDLNHRLIEVIKEDLGKNASIEQVVAYLYKGLSLNDRCVRTHLVGREFFKRVGQNTARCVEEDLGIEFGVSGRMVRYIRSIYAQGKAQQKRGRKKV